MGVRKREPRIGIPPKLKPRNGIPLNWSRELESLKLEPRTGIPKLEPRNGIPKLEPRTGIPLYSNKEHYS
jgi:hypothetical protein